MHTLCSCAREAMPTKKFKKEKRNKVVDFRRNYAHVRGECVCVCVCLCVCVSVCVCVCVCVCVLLEVDRFFSLLLFKFVFL
jgi:hypothetical protein